MTLRLSAAIIGVWLSAVVAAAQPEIDVAAVMEQAEQRVTEFFARAQSLVCVEKVSMQKLDVGFSADGPSRNVESELRVSWEPTAEDPTPSEARTVRQVLRVNGGKPRKKDWNNCTTPEQQDTETMPLSLLLPRQRFDHSFTLAGRERIDGRDAIVIAFRENYAPTVDVSLVDGKEDCVSFDIDGGMRGRIWIDAETFDVLRLDRTLGGLVEIPLPRKVTRFGGNMFWTMERWDRSIRFKRVSFDNPEETLTLPVSESSLQITRGSGTPRLRTQTQYVAYRRFMTGGRIVPQ